MIKYIGIPYELHGRDFNGCDCYGLVYLYLRNEYNIELPKYDYKYDYEDRIELMENEKSLILGDELENPEDGCIVLFYKGIYPSHVGVFDQGGILHIGHSYNSVFEKLHSRSLNRFRKLEFYRVKNYYTA